MSTWEPPDLPFWWTAPTQSAFVGRAPEFERLEAIWSDVLAGARQLVFVGGDPGVGKSRFVSEAAKALHASGAAVLVGHCLADYSTAYQPYGDPVRHLLEATEALLPEAESESIRGRLSALASPDGPPTADSGVEQAYDLFEALVDVLRAVSRNRPVVLVLEDLHWASSSTTQLLSHLTRHLPEARLLIIATHRVARRDQKKTLVSIMANLYRQPGVHRLDLGAFAVADVAEFVALEFQLPTQRARGLADTLCAQTGGNPFLLGEMCRDLHDSADPLALNGDLHVPVTVRDAFEARLALLDDRDRQVIELAAVLSERFTTPTLVSVSPWSKSSTLLALEQAVESGLLEAVKGTTEHRFPHALARQAILDLIPSVRQARKHAMIAKRLAHHSAGTPVEIQQLAHHHYRAAGLGDSTEAVRYIVFAAEFAQAAFAHEEAATYYRQAAEFSEDAIRTQEFTLFAARSYNAAGDFASALELSQQVVQDVDDPDIELGAAICYEDCALKIGLADSRAVSMLATSLRQHESRYDERTYIWGLASLGRAMAFVGASTEAERLQRRTIGRARELDDDHLLAHTLAAGLWSDLPPSQQFNLLAQAQEVTELGRGVRDYHILVVGGLFRASLGYTTGQPEEIASAVADMKLAVERTGSPYYTYWVRCVEYSYAFLAGDFFGAQSIANEILQISSERQGSNTEGLHGFQTFMIRRESGKLSAVRPLISGSEDPRDHWPPALLGLYTELEMREPCRRQLDWMLGAGLDQYQQTAQWGGLLALVAEAALFLHDEATLHLIYPMFQEFEGHNLTSGQFVALFGSADRYAGQIESALNIGDPLSHFRIAEEMDSRMNADVHLAATLAAFAQHCARQVEPEYQVMGQEAARRARAIAEPIDQVRVLRVLDRLDAAEPGRGLAQARMEHPVGLTNRELQVLQALADGSSNKEIAERLVISQNTAANHVRSILMKTGAANRTTAAMMAVSQGWLGS